MRVAAAIVGAGVALAACDQEPMRDQPKYEPYEAAAELPGGVAAMLPPEGTVRRDAVSAAPVPRPPATVARLERGREVFDGICAPCHGQLAEGKGMVVHRGFPPPPDFHGKRLRTVPDRYIYRVITEGYGVMYGYANRVVPKDRWAVIDYIRALQLSQNAEAASLPPGLRRRLDGEGG